MVSEKRYGHVDEIYNESWSADKRRETNTTMPIADVVHRIDKSKVISSGVGELDDRKYS